MTDIKEAQGLEVVGWRTRSGSYTEDGPSAEMRNARGIGPYLPVCYVEDATAVIDQLRERVAELEYAAELDRTADLYAPAGCVMVPVVATKDIEDAIGWARNLKASEIWGCALDAAPKADAVKYDIKGSRKALGAMNAKLKAKIGRLERELAAARENTNE
jgi:hypothetical protein